MFPYNDYEFMNDEGVNLYLMCLDWVKEAE